MFKKEKGEEKKPVTENVQQADVPSGGDYKKRVYAKYSIGRNSVYRFPFLICASLLLKGEKSDIVARGWNEAESSECRRTSSGFKQLSEGGADLLDHVRGGGGTAVLLKGLIVTLPG